MMLTVRGRLLVAAATMLVCAGCSSDSGDDGAAVGAPAETVPASESVPVEEAAEGDDFCTMYATRVSQGLVGIRAAEAGGIETATGIAEEMAARAPVGQAELQAVAPPEPLAWLQEMEEADAKGAAGDFSALDATFENLGLLTDWAIDNCDAEYTPIFVEYKDVIG